MSISEIEEQSLDDAHIMMRKNEAASGDLMQLRPS
jgi:hypothetical protein